MPEEYKMSQETWVARVSALVRHIEIVLHGKDFERCLGQSFCILIGSTTVPLE